MNLRRFGALTLAGIGLAGCSQQQPDPAGGNVNISAPGVDIKAGPNGAEVSAPGVNVKAGPDGTSVKAPGADVKVDK
jgi:hypothetical protein